ncbi:hypothetical protein [Comamonas sp. Tr-654]|uniref:hypothetical protein n=1 Tax=Comamonas sp. Tr-654 TaxID=2608341 RepID=UPI001964BA35|nr:hypothetical protein [Comamonas sp. Tr-654]
MRKPMLLIVLRRNGESEFGTVALRGNQLGTDELAERLGRENLLRQLLDIVHLLPSFLAKWPWADSICNT